LERFWRQYLSWYLLWIRSLSGYGAPIYEVYLHRNLVTIIRSKCCRWTIFEKIREEIYLRHRCEADGA